MIEDLLKAMSSDMNIRRFNGETEDSFFYRLCYSALGHWCLRTAQNSSNGVVGTTKHNQTIVLNDLLSRFSGLFPFIFDKFIDTNNQQINFPVHIRRVYEETGYLLKDDDNRNHIVNYGRSISIGNKSLFFGVPNLDYAVNGLGVFANPTSYKVSTKEFLIRDDLTYDEFFQTRFDLIDFYDRDINTDELEFFNPKSNNVPSRSWANRLQADCTIARKSEAGPFYRVMKMSDKLQFADEPIEPQGDSFTSYEYRRLYFALKAHYKNPLKATITKVDKEYSKVRVEGRLPNREYYYMLLLSWPINNAFNKTNFLIQNDLLLEIITVLENIGIEIKGGHIDE